MQLEAGRFYRTRDGRKAYVGCVGIPGVKGEQIQVPYPAIGYVLCEGRWLRGTWLSDGCWHSDRKESVHDLIAPWDDPVDGTLELEGVRYRVVRER